MDNKQILSVNFKKYENNNSIGCFFKCDCYMDDICYQQKNFLIPKLV